eukprot:9279149-Lingulodinium_polyedra.AAC.1
MGRGGARLVPRRHLEQGAVDRRTVGRDRVAKARLAVVRRLGLEGRALGPADVAGVAFLLPVEDGDRALGPP